MNKRQVFPGSFRLLAILVIVAIILPLALPAPSRAASPPAGRVPAAQPVSPAPTSTQPATVAPSAGDVHYLVGSFTKATGPAPISQTITHNLGVAPKALILWTAGQTTQNVASNYRYAMGFSDGAVSYAFAAASQNGVSSSNTSQRIAAKALTLVQWGEVLSAEANLVSWSATTFTLNWTTNNSSAYIIHYMLIGGADVAAKVVNWQAPTVIGPKAVTGVGFRPDLVLNMNGSNTLTNPAPFSKPGAELALGAMNAAGEQWVTASFINDADGSPPLAASGQRTDAAFAATSMNSSGIFALLASYASMDADGFTLNFSQVGSATQAVSLALRGVVSKLGSFNAPTTAPSSQIIAGLGFRPRAVLLATWGNPGATSVADTARFALGASDGTTQGALGIWEARVSGMAQGALGITEVNTSHTLNYAAQSTGRIVNRPGSTGSILSAATLSSLDSSGFTLSWVAAETNESDQYLYLTLAAPPVPKIGDRVWADHDRDGAQDVGEPGLANVRVLLYDGPCADMASQTARSTTTDANGNYGFLITVAGDYCVTVAEVTVPAGYIATTVLPREVTLATNQAVSDADFGFAAAVADDRLAVGAYAPCVDATWLQQVAQAYSATITSQNAATCGYTVQVAPANLAALQAAVVADPHARHAGPDVQAHGEFTPNDPDYNNAAKVYGPQQISAPAAWDVTTGDPNLSIAIVDTGLDLNHPEFAGRLLPGYDFVNGDADPTDDNGHGTHVAGIAAAGINNSIGLAGIAGSAQLLPVKVLAASNCGWWSDVASGVTWAVDQGAKVVNLSLNGLTDSQALRDAVAYATAKNVLVVVAAGNGATNELTFPASYDQVLSVGGTTNTGIRYTLSNWGPNVDAMAPGSTVWSSYWTAAAGSTYRFMSGTSMAAPHAAGLAALLYSRNPNLTAAQVKDAILSTATDMGDPGVDALTGYGLINAQAAVAALPTASAEPPQTELSWALAVDVRGNGVVDPGDTVRYTVAAGNADVLPLADVVVSDTAPTNTSYVAGSTQLNGIPVRDDDAPASGFPLDAGGLNIGVVAPGTTSRVTFDVVVATPPPAFYSLVNQGVVRAAGVDQAVETTTPVGGTACTLGLVDALGQVAASYFEDDQVFVELADADENYDPATAQTVAVQLADAATGDLEPATLTETGPDTGIFRGSLLSSSAVAAYPGDGVLLARRSDQIAATYTDPDFSPDTCTAAATVTPHVVTKALYLTTPGPGLDRVDPVATGDTSTASSVVIGAGSSTAFTQTAALVRDLVMPAGGLITVTNYISTTGTLPANPSITATLSYNGTTLATLTNPTATPLGDPVMYSTYKVGNFVKSVGAAPASQIITHNLGVAPKALILWTSGQTGETPAGHYRYAQGVSDGTTSYAFTAASQNGVGTTNTSRRVAAKALTIVEWGEVTLAEADLVSWNATSLTLNWTTNNSSAAIIHYLIIGGGDVATKVVNWQMPTSTGNRAVTGVGFQPDLVFHLSAGTGITNTAPASQNQAGTGFGVMNAAGEQWALATFAKDDIGTSATARGQRTDAALLAGGVSGSLQPIHTAVASYVAMHADGFTLNFSTVSPNGNAGQVASLALRGVSSKLGSFAKTMTTGNQAVTGVGFQPEALMLASWARAASTAAEDDAIQVLGAADAITAGVAWFGDWDNLGATNAAGLDKTTKVFSKSNTTANIDAEAGLSSFDADGFTLGWTTNSDGVASQMLYLALDARVSQTYRLDWSGALASDTTAPAGAAINLALSNGEADPILVLYDSATYPSQINLATTTAINVDALGVYDAASPGGTAITQTLSGRTVYVRAVVSDPFGPDDVSSLDLTIELPASCGGPLAVTLGEAAVVATSASTKTYEYPWYPAGCADRQWVRVTTHEGTEGVADAAGLSFAVRPVGNLGDRVWNDQDGDAIQDPAEPGIAGVTVCAATLPSGADATCTVTGADGSYILAELPTGHYTVTVDAASLPADIVFRTTPYPVVHTLGLGEAFLAADFGFRGRGVVIGDTVWYDADADGVQDAGEPGLGNISLALWLDNGDGIFDPTPGLNGDYFVDTTISDAAGAYRFDAPTAGIYFVDVTDDYGLLAGLAHTVGPQSVADPTPAITVALGQVYAAADFGYVRVPPAEHAIIGDLVWVDGNGDGYRQLTEPALIGVSVCATPAGGGAPLCTTTDSNGRYLLAAPAGEYTVTPDTGPLGLTPASPSSLGVIVAAGSQALGVDFPFVSDGTPLGMLGGLVWQDLATGDQTDGVFDPAREPGIPQVSLGLIKDSDGDGIWDGGEPYIATFTILDGSYSFPGLPGGAYLLRVTDSHRVLRYFVPSVAASGASAAAERQSKVQPYAVTLGAGGVDTSGDFGYRELEVFGAADPPEPGMIGDRIWLDADGDGRYDPVQSDQPLAGVTVGAYDAGGGLVASATTDLEGLYLFTDLALADYTLRVTDAFGALAGLVSTQEGAVGTGDVSQAQPYTVTLGLATTDFSADFGYARPAALVGLVFVDQANYGVQDPNETLRLAAVEITLDDGSGHPATVATAEDGAYAFGGLRPGAYSVSAPPVWNGFLLTTPAVVTLLVGVSGAASGPVFGYVAPTAVRLAGFAAVARGAAVQLTWQMALAGQPAPAFHVWRAAGGASWKQLTVAALGPATGDAEIATYSFSDTAIERGVTYLYRLESTTGENFGPWPVRPAAGDVRGFLPLVGR